ncbi:hypothetical protein [Symbiobacterium thermophilum]|uniref:Uncharacterized protein n=1 Tax=Symbiobacterium thermophilum (strain DSM 24528 / JCM 14929 / IAM 14863 / T) TaxID=292459 RepID=Q67NT2_SYMTH|nr:hypothetical protein [Symbiobacterium thermophilum]BAD40661.1 hypothetical protein STH1676 [Symbiobacterium thermophilum IAM 14863]
MGVRPTRDALRGRAPAPAGRRRRVAMLLSALAAVFSAQVLLTGCSARPLPVQPADAVAAALAHPEVADWYAAHSAPRVLAGLNPAAARGLQRFRPDALVDLAAEGLVVRFTSALGEPPKRVDVLIDKDSGQVLDVRMGGVGWRGWR